MSKKGYLSRITRFIVPTFFSLIIQFGIAGGISWYLYGLNLQDFSKVLPNVSFGTIVFGLLFAFNYGTSASKIGDPLSASTLGRSNIWKTVLGQSDNDLGLKLFGRSVVVSGIIALAVLQFVIPNISN